MKIRLLTAAFIASAFAVATAAPPDVKRDDNAKPLPAKTFPFEGTFTVVSGEKNGEAVPADRLGENRVRISRDLIVGTDKDKKELFAASYTVDAMEKDQPTRLKMVSKLPKQLEPVVGLIQVEGDTVKIVYNLPGKPAPKEFKTAEGQHMFVLKRLAEANLSAPETVPEKK